MTITQIPQQVPVTEITTLQTIRQEANALFLERGPIIDISLLSLLASQHAVLIGPPGTGKSALIRHLCSRMHLKFFFYLLHKQTQLDELFGPLDIAAYNNGEFLRDIEDTLADCRVAFLDELWEPGSAVHNAMLRAINERMMRNGKSDLELPLNTVFGASNRLPAQELEAARDRYFFTVPVERLSPGGFDLLMKRKMGLEPTPAALTTLDDVSFDRLQAYIKTIPFGPHVLSGLSNIRAELEKIQVYPSDRHMEWGLRVMQANAVLDGRTEVFDDDLLIYAEALWTDPRQRAQVAAVIGRFANPSTAKANEIKDQAAQDYQEMQKQVKTLGGSKKDIMVVVSEGAAKLAAAIDQLETLQTEASRSGKTNQRIDSALQEIRANQKEALKLVGIK